MILTDIDGVLFEIPQGSIKQIRDRKAYREVITKMNDRLKVKEVQETAFSAPLP